MNPAHWYWWLTRRLPWLLKRLRCVVVGCRMEFVGGCACPFAVEPGGCSIGVSECSRCGLCDYGDESDCRGRLCDNHPESVAA